MDVDTCHKSQLKENTTTNYKCNTTLPITTEPANVPAYWLRYAIWSYS